MGITSSVPLPRGLVLKLLLLFFLAHPGSAATWADPKSFLLHRYPNRDIDVPHFGAAPQQQRRRAEQQHLSHHPLKQQGVGHGIAKEGGNGRRLLFVGPSSPAVGGLFRGGRASSSSAPAASGVRPLQVVIGSFVSELERSPFEPRRKLAKPMQPMQQSQAQQQPAVRMPAGQMQFAMAGSGGGQERQQGQQRGGGGFVMPGLFRQSAATLVDAYDGVLSFVGSRLVTTEQTLSKAFGSVSALTAAGSSSVGSSLTGEPVMGGSSSNKGKGGEAANKVASSATSSSLASAAQRYDLVGFLDLDPFEKSKRHFKKRSTSLTNLLL